MFYEHKFFYILYNDLFQAYPYKKDALIKEARKDIPPFYRPLIWAALLHIDGAVAENYDIVDKETPTTTDRQVWKFCLLI